MQQLLTLNSLKVHGEFTTLIGFAEQSLFKCTDTFYLNFFWRVKEIGKFTDDWKVTFRMSSVKDDRAFTNTITLHSRLFVLELYLTEVRRKGTTQSTPAVLLKVS